MRTHYLRFVLLCDTFLLFEERSSLCVHIIINGHFFLVLSFFGCFISARCSAETFCELVFTFASYTLGKRSTPSTTTNQHLNTPTNNTMSRLTFCYNTQHLERTDTRHALELLFYYTASHLPSTSFLAFYFLSPLSRSTG